MSAQDLSIRPALPTPKDSYGKGVKPGYGNDVKSGYGNDVKPSYGGETHHQPHGGHVHDSHCGHAEGRCGFVGLEILSVYKSHITGLSSLLLILEALIIRCEAAECDRDDRVRDCDGLREQITIIQAEIVKVRVELDRCGRERDEACGEVEKWKGRVREVEESFEIERTDWSRKEESFHAEIIKFKKRIVEIEEERDEACRERDRCKCECERLEGEIEVIRVTVVELEAKYKRQICDWEEKWKCANTDSSEVHVLIEELRKEKIRIEVEYESERVKWREVEKKCNKEICEWRDKCKVVEERCNRCEVELKECSVKYEQECTRHRHSIKEIADLKEQIRMWMKRAKESKESEEVASETLSRTAVEVKRYKKERDEFEIQIIELRERLACIEEQGCGRDGCGAGGNGGVTTEHNCDFKTEVVKCRTELDECRAHLDTYLPHPDKRKHKVCIDKVIYGGKVIDDAQVLKNIQDCADTGKPFKPTNQSCGYTPKNGCNFVASYVIDNKGPVRYVAVPEGKDVQFK
jgi:hypothetical protein